MSAGSNPADIESASQGADGGSAASPPAAPGRAAGYFRGWEVVAGCFVMATVAWGLGFYGNGLYLAYLVGERGMPIEIVSAGITVYYWVGAVLIMTCGGLIDRLGPRRSVSLGAVSMAVAVLTIANVQAVWQFYAALGLMAVGWVTMSSSAINTILAPWFDRKRGTALSLALTGASFGGIAVIPLVTALTRVWGHRIGLSIAAVGLCLIVVGVAWRCFVRSPRLVDQNVDGDPTPAGKPPLDTESATRSAPEHAAEPAPRWTFSRVVRTPGFLSNVVPFSVGLTIQVGLLTHQISMLAPRLGNDGAAWAVGVTTMCAVVGRLIAGVLMDRLPRRAVAALNFLSQVLGLLLLAGAREPLALYLGCALCGLAVGNMISFSGLLIQREFPSSQFNRVNRLAVGGGQILYACGPFLMAFFREATGSYSAPLYGCAALGATAGLIVWFGRPAVHRAA